MLLYEPVDLDHRTQTEIVGPTIQLLVQLPNFLRGRPVARSPIRYLANLPAQLPDLFQRGTRPQIGPARPKRVITSERIPHERERTLREATPTRLLFVHGQFQLGH